MTGFYIRVTLAFYGLSTEIYPQTQDINWTYVKCSEDVMGVFWTSYVPSVQVLYPQGKPLAMENDKMSVRFAGFVDAWKILRSWFRNNWFKLCLYFIVKYVYFLSMRPRTVKNKMVSRQFSTEDKYLSKFPASTETVSKDVLPLSLSLNLNSYFSAGFYHFILKVH